MTVRAATTFIALVWLRVAMVAGQNVAAPAFDVVSIKENTSENAGGSAAPRGTNRWVAESFPVAGLLSMAWNIPSDRVIGLPDWGKAIRYDVDARGDVSHAWDDVRPKLQTLLRERFNVAAHVESRELPTYNLTRLQAERLGPSLVKSPITDCNNRQAIAAISPPPRPCGFAPQPGGLKGTVSPATLASLLTTASGRPVFDKTGLQGNYEFDLKFSRNASDDAVSIFTAVQEQLGLKLDSSSAPLDVLIVEHVERPTAN